MTTPVPILVERGEAGGFPAGILLLIVFIGIICVVFLLAWTLLKSRSKNAGDVLQTPASAASTPPESYLLSVTLTKAGEWDIRVKGQRYRGLEVVPDEKTRREVVAALKELANFSRGYIQKEPSGSSSITAEPIAPPLSMPSLIHPAAPAEPARPAASVTPPAVEPARAAPSGAAPRLRLSGEPELRRTSAPAKLMPTIDLAREVGDILAEMQAQRPDLRGRSIKLRNAASGGVEFNLDGIAYGSLDEIPEPDVRDLIQAAIKEWERR